MANPVLGKLQGQGLMESTTAGLQQAGAQLATTPVGAAMQGRGPDSTKMAATQPAKINALATGMRDVNSAALSQLRETSRIMEGTEAEKATAKTAQNATVLGRIDNRIANLAQNSILASWSKTSEGFKGLKLDEKKLKDIAKFTDTEIGNLSIALKELQAGGPITLPTGGPSDGLTQADIDLINKALVGTGAPATLDFTAVDGKTKSANALATTVADLYIQDTAGESKEKIKQAIIDAKSSTKIGALTEADAKLIIDGSDAGSATKADLINLLKSITGITDENKINAMSLAELRTSIDNWKQSEFKDVAALRKTLTEEGAKSARGQLALQELRRLGQVGVTSAEAKVNDIQKQMDEGDTVTINGKAIPVESLFSDPELLVQMQSWIDDPSSAPKELQGYLTKNQDGIQIKVAELMGATANGDVKATGITAAMQRVSDNIAAGKLDDSLKDYPDDTVEKFFPGWSTFGIDSKIPASEDAYKTSVADAAVAAAKATNPNLTPEEQAKIRTNATSPEALAKDPEYTKYLKYKVLQTPGLAEHAGLLLTGLKTLGGVDGKKIFDELTPDQLRTLCASAKSVNNFTLGLTYRQDATTFKGDTNFSTEFKDVADKLNLGSTAALFANLADNDLTNYKDIFEKANLSGKDATVELLVTKNGKTTLNTAALADMVKGIGKMSTADVLAGKVKTAIEDMQMLFTKLNTQLGRDEEATTPLPAEIDRERLFVESGEGGEFGETSQQKLDKLLADEGKLGGENHTNWAAYNAAFIAAQNFEAPSRPDYSDYDGDRAAFEADLTRYNEQRDKYERIVQGMRDAYSRWKDSESRFWAVKNSRIDLENNRATYDKNRRDKYDAWWRKYEKKLSDDNAATRKRYADLGDIFTGVA